jgi:transcriptional regulator with XRE-family HTH domain
VEERPAIGARLREARLRQGLEIADCAAATRIRERYLVAIEDGRFESLPDPAFVNGFVRAYAEHLGVTVEGPVRELPPNALAPAGGRSRSRPVHLSATRITARGVGAPPPAWRRPWVLVVVALVAAVAVAAWAGVLPAL